VLDPDSPGHTAAFALLNPDSTSSFYGNVVVSPSAVFDLHFAGAGMFTSDQSLFGGSTHSQRPFGEVYTMAQWQAFGHDLATLLGDPMFADAAAGNYALLAGSPAIDALNLSPAELALLTDFLGRPRPSGEHHDLGAYEFQAVPEPAALGVTLAALVTLLARRRRR
jgi:hypothetical protein